MCTTGNGGDKVEMYTMGRDRDTGKVSVLLCCLKTIAVQSTPVSSFLGSPHPRSSPSHELSLRPSLRSLVPPDQLERVIVAKRDPTTRQKGREKRTLSGPHGLEGGLVAKGVLSRLDDKLESRVDVLGRLGGLGLLLQGQGQRGRSKGIRKGSDEGGKT